MKKILCLVPFLLILSGCWTTPIKVETKVELTPDNLLIHPCDVIPAGGTVTTLSKGYIHNTQCVHLYKGLVEEQKEYKKKVEEIYGITK